MRNFYEQFAAAAARFPGRTAVEVVRRDDVESFTYAELRGTAERVAAWLTNRGIRRGDRCCILAENDGNWCAAYLAILRVGAVAVPLDTAYKAAQLATLFADSGTRLVFTSPRHLAAVRDGASLSTPEGLSIVLLPAGADAAPHPADTLRWADICAAGAMHGSRLAACPAGASDTAVILYTSGTTADPKGVMLTHANLLAERDAAFQVVSATQHDCILGVLPLFHALAQMANLLLPLSIGARVVFLETVNTTELLRALAERGVTLFACVPQFFYLIHQRVMQEVERAGVAKRSAFRLLLRTSGLLRRGGINPGRLFFGRIHRVLGGRMRLMVTGGSRFDPAIGKDLYNLGFDILQAYGLTETSGAATLMHPGDRHLETVGHPLPGTEIRILSDGSPEGLPHVRLLHPEGLPHVRLPHPEGLPHVPDEEAQDGEVLIRGPVVMAGYFNRPDATAAALRDGWLHTGDLGRLDADGRLSITGRRKELIVLSSGKNIYPEEVEANYRRSPVIKELCVLGLTRPGEPSAERLYAVVVPDPDVLRERRIVNAGELVRFEMESLSVGLPPHKRVLGYEVWREPLPRTTTGKLKRFEIERRLGTVQAERAMPPSSSILTEEERAWAESPDVAPVLAVIQAAARAGQVRPDGNLELDVGLDSMERVELLAALEGRFGARIPEEVAQRTQTARELVDAILAHRKEGGAETDANAWDTLLTADMGSDPRLAPLSERRPLGTIVLFVLLHALLAIFRTVVRIDVSGRAHLPPRGPFIISPNHQSYLDAFVVVGLLPFRVVRDLFFVGASEYFEGRVLQWLAARCNIVPVDPDAALVSAMQVSAFGLRCGKVLVLFPEGERSIDGTVRNFKKGAAILAHHVDVPIVPVALDGLFDVWPRTRPINWRILRPWKRAVVMVRFGAPVTAGTPASTGGRTWGSPSGLQSPPQPLPPEAYAQTMARVRSEVETMWSDIHRARVARSPAHSELPGQGGL